MEIWDSTIKKIVLEVKIPKEILKPIKAMEHVFAGFHAIHDVITWREKWLEGQFQLGFSLEIVSIDGEVHFYIRTYEPLRGIIESNIYAHYPEVEISEIPDYTLNVPQDIPNKDWDLWGTSLINTKPNAYPIKTYTEFELETLTKEEKRVDPLAELLEGLGALGKGEQLWVQIICKPVREEKPWVKEGRELRDELAKREKPKKKSILAEATDILLFGPQELKKESVGLEAPELRLTPGEREIIESVERKISKFGFDCVVRYIYLAKRDVFFKPRARTPYSFFKEVSIEGRGGFKPDKKLMTKVNSVFFWFLDKRRLYIRQRRIFRYYQKRWMPLFPRPGKTYILNTEELATLFHFPGEEVAQTPALHRIEAKKGEAPPSLPTE